MALSSNKGSKTEADVNLMWKLQVEEDEEDAFSDDEIDIINETIPTGFTQIRDLKSYTRESFRGVIRWKKEGFLARDHKTFICRVRPGDEKDYRGFVQISAYNESGKWMNENLQDGQCYEFVGLRLKKADRRFVPLSHEVEAVFDLRYSSFPRSIPTPDHFPQRMHYNFQLFDQIQTQHSTCVEVDGIMRKGAHSIQRIVVVDKSLLKFEFYLWNDDIYQLQMKEGMTMLLQGLKVVRFATYVAFFVLRCKHIEMNASICETMTLSRWWTKEGGAKENFKNFPELENPIHRFISALNYYKENFTKMKLTNRALASTYGVHESTLCRFFVSNGIRRCQPQEVAPLRKKYNNGEGTMAQICEGTSVKVGALKTARRNAGEAKTTLQNKKQPQLVAEARLKIKSKRTSQTMKSIITQMPSISYDAVKAARRRAGDAKQQQPQLILQPIRYYLDHSVTYKDVADHFNQGKPKEDWIKHKTSQAQLSNLKKKHPSTWKTFLPTTCL